MQDRMLVTGFLLFFLKLNEEGKTSEPIARFMRTTFPFINS
jgi:hypothetical protein